MKKHITFTNLLFVVALFLMVYSPTREWFLRQISFSPSVIEIQKAEQIDTYQWQLKGVTTEDLNFENVKNKVVLVNFWATWCPPCRAEMPMLQDLYRAYKDKLVFVLVSNEEEQKIISFLSEKGYDFPVYQSLTTPPSLFRATNSIPATYLIDKKGRVRISKTGTADWNSDKVHKLIDQLLEE
ncbi:MAG: TlpA family protein disulfide reductase [Flavobacteriaceae bacterium]|nr:TlpA family protein disulfide reductase [Flavobacteriaceae bacterium]